MSKTICDRYSGITCANGNCPNALADDYPDSGIEKTTCSNCSYYKGCDDCAFCNKDGSCSLEY